MSAIHWIFSVILLLFANRSTFGKWISSNDIDLVEGHGDGNWLQDGIQVEVPQVYTTIRVEPCPLLDTHGIYTKQVSFHLQLRKYEINWKDGKMFEHSLISVLAITHCNAATSIQEGLTTSGSGFEHDKCYQTVTTASGTLAPSTICAGQLIFQDDFDNLNLKTWEHQSNWRGIEEFQWYTNNRRNSFAKDGILYIRPTPWAEEFENDTDFKNSADGTEYIRYPIKSARIRTSNSFRFKYGKLEVRAKMPAGDWLFPAIWLIPFGGVYGGWPCSGEIDLVECRGNRYMVEGGIQVGAQQVSSTLHFGLNRSYESWRETHNVLNDETGFDSRFRVYQLHWTPDNIKFSIDNKQLLSITPSAMGFYGIGKFNERAPGIRNIWEKGTKMTPFDEEFYVIINLAVGGTAMFQDNVKYENKKPWKNKSPSDENERHLEEM